MNFLETMFYRLIEEPEPQTPEYRENRNVRADLLAGSTGPWARVWRKR